VTLLSCDFGHVTEKRLAIAVAAKFRARFLPECLELKNRNLLVLGLASSTGWSESSHSLCLLPLERLPGELQG